MVRNAFRYSLTLAFSALLLQSGAFAYQLDKTTNTINIEPGNTPALTTIDLRNAFAYLTNRSDKTTPWTLKMAPGKYYLTAQVSSSGLQNTTIASADATNPAQLIKVQGWDSATSAEYLLSFRMCDHITLSGLAFYGQTSFAQSADPYWPDQGVYLGSCNVVRVEQSQFYNFGNAALRVVTDVHDPVLGVNSFKTTVINNTFNNIYQTATTSTDEIHGGTAYSSWMNNTFNNLRGSIKFASRTPGAKTIEFVNNVVNGGDHFGLEINNYNDFKIKGNLFKNLASVAINVYTAAGIKGFPWGDDFTISNNTIDNVGRAIRYSHEPSVDGFQYVPANLLIDNNTISRVNETTANVPAISVLNGTINNVQVTNNKFSGIINKKYLDIFPSCMNVSTLGNTLDGISLDALIPKIPTTASVKSTK